MGFRVVHLKDAWICVGLGGSLPPHVLQHASLVPSSVVFGWDCPICSQLRSCFGLRTVFKVQTSMTTLCIWIGLVVWNGISASIGSAPNLFEHNQMHVHNTNLNPIFYVLEEWAFQLQTFLQSFALVVLALSWFQHDLLLNLFTYGVLPLINLFLFLFWAPMIVCLLGARYRDLYQLVPIVLQLVFLLSPILYRKDNLGAMAWTANFNPLYRILSPVRHSLMAGEVQWILALLMLYKFSWYVYCFSLVESRALKHPFLI